MALPWPSGTPLLARPTASAPAASATAAPAADRSSDAATPGLVAKARAVALEPMTTLVALLLGLVLLFALPLVGLPYLAVVVLPAVIYQLRAERRPQITSARR